MLDKIFLVDINVFSLTISIFILVDLNFKFDRQFLQSRLFRYMLLLNIALIVLDTGVRAIDGVAGMPGIALSYISCYLFYILEPLPFYLWALYARLQVYRDEKKILKSHILFVIPYFLYLLLVLTNPITNGIFYITQAGVYKRGFLIPAVAAACFLYGVYVYVLLVKERKKLERRNFNALMIFPLPPILGGLMQALIAGHSFLWPAVTLSVLVIYVNIQNSHISTDYLTGVYNRREADGYIKSRIDNGNDFSGILIDIDKFKEINDRFGHLTGDDALETITQIIKKTLRRGDFIARYGGDEFLVILNLSDREGLEKAAERILKAAKDFNSQHIKPYSCSLSLGYAIFERDKYKNEDQFIHEIDRLMYKHKKTKYSI